MNEIIWFWILAGLGIAFFIFFTFRRDYRVNDRIDELKKPIEHYKDIRDDLTYRDGERKKDVEKDGGINWSSLIVGIVSLTVVAIVFAQVLMPILVTTNTTGWQSSACDTLQIISVVGFIFVLLAVFSGVSDSSDEPKKSRKVKKMNKNVEHYTTIRDDMTYRDNRRVKDSIEEVVEDDDESISY